MIKRLAANLPIAWQQTLRRYKCRLDMKSGRFRPLDPEFDYLDRLIKPGDWVLDIGANVGYYTLRLSELVGAQGRVFAFEPIARTVEVLAANVRYARHDNVTIFQTAASDQSRLLEFSVEVGKDGLPDYFTARSGDTGDLQLAAKFAIFGVSMDSLNFPHRVSLVKIDTEGAERSVLAGMEQLIRRDHPTLIVECHESLIPYLESFGYTAVPRKGRSANILFLPSGFATPDASLQKDLLHAAEALRERQQQSVAAAGNSGKR